MTTPNASNPPAFPPPIVNDVYLSPRAGDGEVGDPKRGTRLNTATGEYRIAELVRGVLYDTERSTLVASVTTTDAANGFYLRRLYGTEAGHWFLVHFTWWNRLFATADEFLWPLPDDAVLAIATALVPDKDCLRFIFDWYAAGLIPRADFIANHWAERVLSEVDLEAAHAAIASLPAAS